MALSEFMLLAGTANPTLAEDISNALGTKVGRARVGVFSDHEIRVEIHENIRGRDVFLVHSQNGTLYPRRRSSLARALFSAL